VFIQNDSTPLASLTWRANFTAILGPKFVQFPEDIVIIDFQETFFFTEKNLFVLI
jgi:hypothetical protein